MPDMKNAGSWKLNINNIILTRLTPTNASLGYTEKYKFMLFHINQTVLLITRDCNSDYTSKIIKMLHKSDLAFPVKLSSLIKKRTLKGLCIII